MEQPPPTFRDLVMRIFGGDYIRSEIESGAFMRFELAPGSPWSGVPGESSLNDAYFREAEACARDLIASLLDENGACWVAILWRSSLPLRAHLRFENIVGHSGIPLASWNRTLWPLSEFHLNDEELPTDTPRRDCWYSCHTVLTAQAIQRFAETIVHEDFRPWAQKTGAEFLFMNVERQVLLKVYDDRGAWAEARSAGVLGPLFARQASAVIEAWETTADSNARRR